MLLGEMRRWGVAREMVDELLPNAARAIEWIEQFGDADGDGYVEYKRATDRGLANQGWKDSWDGIRYGDGRVAEAPIALCEVQAYTYGAYLASAHFAFEVGDTATYDRFRAKAAQLKAAFNRDFWLEDKGWFAVGLDADKRPIDSLTSNIGHCLWTGIVDEDKARRVAEALVSPAMFSGWGVRTLSKDSGGYNPISYHCGSVWPHDTAIVAAGLARYGYRRRRPEADLRPAGRGPAPRAAGCPSCSAGSTAASCRCRSGYPTSCSPQAWAAASPLLCLRTLLRLDPWIPYGKTWLCPNLPEWIGYLKVEGIPLAGSRVTIEVGLRGARRGGRSAACPPRSSWSASPAGPRPRSEPGRRAGHQPRSIHSPRWGDSAPMVVPAPCPGRTMVSASNEANSRSSMELMMVEKSECSKEVLPGPPGKRVSPVNSRGVPSTAKHIEPGVWPGVAMVAIRSRPTSSTERVLEDLVVGGEHARVGRGHGDVDPGVADGLDGLDVVPVPVGLHHLADVEGRAQLEQLVVLVGRVDQEGLAGGPAPDDVDVVVHRPDHEPVDLDRRCPGSR